MTQEIKYGDIGAPAFETEDFTTKEIRAGGDGARTQDLPFAAALVTTAALPAFTVVGLASGVLALAKADKSVQALGITATDIPAGTASGTVPVIRTGTYRPSALNFDATYDTTAKKLAAFEDAPTPTQIFMVEPIYE